MDDEEGGKVNGIRQMVRLRELLQKWQSMTITEKENNSNNNINNSPSSPEDSSGHGGISPAINRRLKNSYVLCDSDEENWNSPEPPPDVPKGYLAVYVGPELRRFIIPTSYLSLPIFKLLLEKAEEEFGFDHKGGLTIPCEIETFKFLLQFMENNHKDHQDHSDAHAEGQSSSVEE